MLFVSLISFFRSACAFFAVQFIGPTGRIDREKCLHWLESIQALNNRDNHFSQLFGVHLHLWCRLHAVSASCSVLVMRCRLHAVSALCSVLVMRCRLHAVSALCGVRFVRCRLRAVSASCRVRLMQFYFIYFISLASPT